ncbi:MAG: hypothetical protein HYU63_05590 [Armatimonadetes bacterium]|nr:hypothetical protein [Armatimonadota bacterium]
MKINLPVDPIKIEKAWEKKKTPSRQIPAKFIPHASASKKDWSCLFYLDGNNNLQGLANATLKQLETIGSNDKIDLAAQISRNKHWYDKFTKDSSGARRYDIEKNPYPIDPLSLKEMLSWRFPPFTRGVFSKVKEDLGPIDMGDPKNLENFILWGIKNHPAKHYLVVLMNHGAGFLGSMHDERTNNIISNQELAGVLENVYEKTGVKVDIIAFDACLMGQSEVAYELKDKAKIMIGSEENEAGLAAPFANILKNLNHETQNGKEVTPEELAKIYINECANQTLADPFTPTQSALNLNKIKEVKNAADELAAHLKNSDIPNELIRQIIKNTQRYCLAIDYKPYTDYRDLYHFAENLLNNPEINDQKIKESAKLVIQAVRESVISEEHVGKGVENSHGLSVYLPLNYGYDQAPRPFPPSSFDKMHHYPQMSWAKDSNWDEMLKKYAQDTKFNEFLRQLGVSEKVIDLLHSGALIIEKPLKLGLNLAEHIGSWEAYQAIKSNKPKKYLFLAGELAAKIGAIGGTYSAFNGAKEIFEGLKTSPNDQDKRMAKIVDGVLDTTTGIAVSAACLGLLAAEISKVSAPAGIVSAALPIAKAIFDAYMKIKDKGNLKDKPKDLIKEILTTITPAGLIGTVVSPITQAVLGIFKKVKGENLPENKSNFKEKLASILSPL